MPKAPINAVLAVRLRSAREALGISQSELGRRMDLPDEVASSRVNRYERARHAPDIATAEALAEQLEIPLPALLAREDDLAELIASFALMSATQRRKVLKAVREALGAESSGRVREKVGSAPATGSGKPSAG